MKTALRVHAVPALALAVAVLWLAGCGSGSLYDGSIYYYIETEEVVTDSSLANDSNCFNVVRLGPEEAPVYYVAYGQIRSGTLAAASSGRAIAWGDSLEILPAGAVCNSLAAFGGDLYGSFVPYQATQAIGLYKADAEADGTLSAPASFVPVAALAGRQVIRLYVSSEGGGRLIAVTAENPSTTDVSVPYSNYVVYGSYDGVVFTPLHDAGTAVVKDIGYQASTGHYWILFDRELIRLDSGNGYAKTTVTPAGLESDDALTAVTCCTITSSTRVYLASTQGLIRYTDDQGATWTASSEIVVTGSGVVVPFLSIAEVPAAGGAAACVLAGAQGYGYYTVGSDLSVTQYPDKNYADLRVSAIRRFTVDIHGGGATLFALTTNYGLWRCEVAATVTWNQE